MTSLFSFFAAEHRCGASMISQCVSERIAEERPDLKIMLIHLQPRPGTDYSPSVKEGMDDIIPYLSDRLLDAGELFEKCRWKDNLYILGGADRIGSFSVCHPDMSAFLIESLKPFCDLMICDCGAEAEHGLSLGALCAFGGVFHVITQEMSSMRRYEWLEALFEKLQPETCGLIINKYDRSEAITVEHICQRFELDPGIVFTLRNSNAGKWAESEGKSILSYKDRGFRRDIDAVCREILDLSGLEDE